MNNVTSLLASLRDSANIFRLKALAYPADRRREKPTSIAFSATEIVYHMLEVEHLWHRRINGLVSGASREFIGINPDALAAEASYNTQPYEAGLERWLAAREETFTLIRGLTEEQLLLEGVHSKYGPMSVLDILERMSSHDLGHAAQLDRTLQQLTTTAE